MSLMQLNRATELDIGKQIERLCAVFGGKPYQANATTMAAEWHRSLSPRFSLDVIRQAVDLCGDNAPKFPTLKQFRDCCFQVERDRLPPAQQGSLKAQYEAWYVDPWNGITDGRFSLPCPVCGSNIEATSRGYLIVHDDEAHTRARVSFSNHGNPEWHTPQITPADKAKAQIREVISKQPDRVIWEEAPPPPEPPPDAILILSAGGAHGK